MSIFVNFSKLRRTTTGGLGALWGPYGAHGAHGGPMGPMFPHLEKLVSEKVSTILEFPFWGVKAKVVRAEILNKIMCILSRGDPYLIVSRTVKFLT